MQIIFQRKSVTQDDKLAAINQLLIKERNSFQLQIKQKEKEISKLMAELENLRTKVKDIETDKDSADEKFLNLLEKQRINSPMLLVESK